MTQKSGLEKSNGHAIKAPVEISPSEALIIRVLRANGEITRSEISKISSWSKAKTSQEVNLLVEKGYLVDVGEGKSKGGRKPRLLRINGKLGYVAGIDIGATSIDIALADLNGEILTRASEDADVLQSPEEFLGRCKEIILDLVAEIEKSPAEILGIGIGVPGPVDFAKGVLVAPPLMPDWENFPIREFFLDTFQSAHVVVDNDVNIMALGEQRFGEAKSIDHFLVIKIGTGIGCGIMASRKIHRGYNGSAGDIGHICEDRDGPICRCGNQGCLEAMAAGPAIAARAMHAVKEGKSQMLKKLMEENGGFLTPEDVNSACRKGDEAALEIIRASGTMIGNVLASLVNFFNPSHIFISGGVSNFGNHLLIAIKQAVLRRSLPLATSNLVIKFSTTGSDAGILGAIMLALEHIFVVEEDTLNKIISS
jgi:glucokinase-like ROK family protein